MKVASVDRTHRRGMQERRWEGQEGHKIAEPTNHTGAFGPYLKNNRKLLKGLKQRKDGMRFPDSFSQ